MGLLHFCLFDEMKPNFSSFDLQVFPLHYHIKLKAKTNPKL